MEYNNWTRCQNYLLVEKLSSTSTKEEWAEIMEKVDSSDSLKLESYRLKAMRKYAIVRGVPLESVDFEDIQNSPQKVDGWAEMNVAVPGIDSSATEDETSTAGGTTPVTPARPNPKARTAPTKKRQAPEGEPGPEVTTKRISSTRRKTSAEAAANKLQEERSKELLCLTQRADQVTAGICSSADSFPSQYSWARPLLEEFKNLQQSYADALKPPIGEDLTEFVNELRLSVISPVAMKSIKKNYRDNYFRMVTLFNDRCGTICEQCLAYWLVLGLCCFSLSWLNTGIWSQ